tara:strand:- start:10 stop:420 length:411 start_codon:yes stop_codon:yes gene_type:complete
MLQALIPILAPILGDTIKRVMPDKDKQVEAEREIRLALLEKSTEIESAANNIILAEAKSEHWITASWRPILMLTITAIIFWNYLAGPLISAIFQFNLVLELPDQLWTLLTVGVGGYAVGRSGEKISQNLRRTNGDK